MNSEQIKALETNINDVPKLVQEFGCQVIDQVAMDKFIQVTNGQKPHHFLRRGIFTFHRGLTQLLDEYQKGRPFYLYTGRGPSSKSLHLGHLIPLEFTKYLQDVFDAPLVIQMTDDEKYLKNPKLTLEEAHHNFVENMKDLIAIGFNPEKTFIFSDIQYIQYLYPNILRMQRKVNYSQIKATFGVKPDQNIGLHAFPINQATPVLASSFPLVLPQKDPKDKKSKPMNCLIPAAIDQDPYFRMTRDICAVLHEPKPATIYSSYLPDLLGLSAKMSSTTQTGQNSGVIFLDTPPNRIKKIINKHAFSGGKDTEEEHRQFGGNTDIDVSYQYLRYFLDDDEQLEQIGEDYRSGKLLSGQLKKILIDLLTDKLTQFQARRAAITDEDIEKFTSLRMIS